MKHFAILLSSVCLLVAPTLPARASLVAETPPTVDNMRCLTLLLTDPDAHAAECGGPFTIDKGTNPVGGSGIGQGCRPIAAAVLPFVGDDWFGKASAVSRVRVAEPIVCCDQSFLTPQFVDLSVGEIIRVAVSCPP